MALLWKSMIRLWLSKRSSVALRDQLSAQIMLGILSEDLKPGQRLPSVRDLGRRIRIHANTVSAAYQDLEKRGWLESRRGSGVFVRAPEETARPTADGMLVSALNAAREQGWTDEQIQQRVATLLLRNQFERILLIEPEVELRHIYRAEVQGAVRVEVANGDYEDLRKEPKLPGALVVATRARQAQILSAIPAGTPCLFLKLRSIPATLKTEQRPASSMLIAVASRSPELLHWTRTVLLSVGLDPDALSFIDARQPGWQNRIGSSDLIVADLVTASALPSMRRVRIVRVLAEESLHELRAMSDNSGPMIGVS